MLEGQDAWIPAFAGMTGGCPTTQQASTVTSKRTSAGHRIGVLRYLPVSRPTPAGDGLSTRGGVSKGVSMADWFDSRRSQVLAKNGMVATSQPVASSTGLRILMEGGNAVDACVGMAAVQAVIEPVSTGLCGDLFRLDMDGPREAGPSVERQWPSSSGGVHRRASPAGSHPNSGAQPLRRIGAGHRGRLANTHRRLRHHDPVRIAPTCHPLCRGGVRHHGGHLQAMGRGCTCADAVPLGARNCYSTVEPRERAT